AVASGGSVTAARRSLAALSHGARQQALREAAGAARARFVDEAQPGVRGEELVEWREDSGLALGPDANAAVGAYWRAVSEAEPAVTGRVPALADEVGARVAGVEHRVKDVEALRRKLADRLRVDNGSPVPDPDADGAGQRVLTLLAEQGDTLRYTLVIDDRRYASAVSDAAARLDDAAMSLTSFRNTWRGMRYRGINTTWTDPATGVRFEVQFHTPATWRATVLTHPWYEIYRRPDTPPTVREELETRIAAVYAEAPLPRR